jgi:UDP-N-acetyl-D-mannosaminuronic acid transferase (WecB/TagA/CpsF family)
MERALQEERATPLLEARILGVRVHRVRMDDALQRIEWLIRRAEPSLVITADANAVLIALEDAEFHALMETAALVTPDGFGLLWAGRRLGQPFPERVSGVDLVERLTHLSHTKGYRLYLLGAAPGVAERAAQNLLACYPTRRLSASSTATSPPPTSLPSSRRSPPRSPMCCWSGWACRAKRSGHGDIGNSLAFP